MPKEKEIVSTAKCKKCGKKTKWGGIITGTRKFHCKGCDETTESFFYCVNVDGN